MDWLRNADYSIFREINVNLHSSILDPISTLLSYTGLGQVLVPAYLLLAIWKQTRWLVAPLLGVLLLSGGIIADVVIKGHPERLRPSNLKFAFVEEPHYHSSFPSGHSCDAFGTAFLLLFLLWNTPYRKWGWVALVWAVFVGLSRIYRGVHWPTDVLGGALVGLVSACIVTGITNHFSGNRSKS